MNNTCAVILNPPNSDEESQLSGVETLRYAQGDKLVGG
jgi:hypothetical protein